MLYHVEAQLLRASSRGIRHSSSSAPRLAAAATATAPRPSAPQATPQAPSGRPSVTSLGGIVIENIPTGVSPPPRAFNQNRDNRARNTQLRDARVGGDQPRDNRPRDNRPRDNQARDNRPRDSQVRDNRPRDNQVRDNRPRDNRPRDNQLRDNRPRDNQPRDNRPRDNQARDDRPRDAQGRDNRPRGNQPRDGRASAPSDGSAPRRWNNQNPRNRPPQMDLGWKDDLVPNSFASRLVTHSHTLHPTPATEQVSVTDQSSVTGQALATDQASATGQASVTEQASITEQAVTEEGSSLAPAEPRVRLINKGRRERGDRQHDSRKQDSTQTENQGPVYPKRQTTQNPPAAEKRGKNENQVSSVNTAVINSKMQSLEDTDLSTLFGHPVLASHVSPRVRGVLARTAGDYSQYLSRRVALGTTGKLGIKPVSYARHVLGLRRDVGLGQRRQALRVIGAFVKAKPTSGTKTASA